MNLSRRAAFGGLIVALALALVPAARADQISYTLTNPGGNTWQYSYTLTNTTTPAGIYLFDIYFPAVSNPDASAYSGITETSNPDPTNWITTVFAPSAPNLGAIYDAYALTTPIALNDSLGGFSVSFQYSGTMPLGPQYFEIYDTSYNLLGSGTTSPATAPVPEPSAMLLLASGLTAATLAARRRRKRD